MLSAGFLSLQSLRFRLLPGVQPGRNDYDEALIGIGKGVARAFEKHCNRDFVRAEGTVYETDAARSSVILRALPVEVVSSVEVVSYQESRDVTADIAGLMKSPGIVRFGYVLGSSLDTVRVTYTGGFWLDDGAAMPAGATPLPSDILEAYVQQCQAEAEARDLFDLNAMRSDAKDMNEKSGLIPRVKEILNQYIRHAA